MLAFITSLRHPRNSADYKRVEQLLAETLVSITAQTTDDFVVIVVGNQRPALDLPGNVHFVPVTFPAPSGHNGPQTPLPAFVWDKGTKIGVGLAAARQFEPDYVMIFDADDFVHKDLARYVRENSGVSGWVIDRGYVYSRARNVYRNQNEFNRTCGTCHVVAYSLYEVPDDLMVTASQDDVANAFGERMSRVLGAHRRGVEWFEDQGHALRPLPFRGAVYHVDTGENHSGKRMRGMAFPLGKRMSDSFGIASRPVSARLVWSALGPVAFVETVINLGRSVVGRVLARYRSSPGTTGR